MRIPESFELGFSSLREKGVLQVIRPESLPKHIVRTVGDLSTVNLMVLSCCDGHQFMHVTQHTKFCCEEAKRQLGLECVADDCFHWRTENGGPFVLTVPSLEIDDYRGDPINVKRSALRTIERGMSLKEHINVVLLIGHCVCGMVKDVFRRPEEYSDHMARAKEVIMSEMDLPSNQVIAWLQGHHSVGREMYHTDYTSVCQLRAA